MLQIDLNMILAILWYAYVRPGINRISDHIRNRFWRIQSSYHFYSRMAVYIAGSAQVRGLLPRFYSERFDWSKASAEWSGDLNGIRLFPQIGGPFRKCPCNIIKSHTIWGLWAVHARAATQQQRCGNSQYGRFYTLEVFLWVSF